MEGESVADGEVEIVGDGESGSPARAGIRADGLTAHEDDLAMAERMEVAERETGAFLAVEDDV